MRIMDVADIHAPQNTWPHMVEYNVLPADNNENRGLVFSTIMINKLSYLPEFLISSKLSRQIGQAGGVDDPAVLVAVEEGPGNGSCETRASNSALEAEGASGTGGRDTCPPASGFLLLWLYKMGEFINKCKLRGFG